MHGLTDDNRHTLLIIDDSPDWTDLLSAYFSNKYRVKVANSAANAVELAQGEPPSIIIVDLVMPSVDGFGVIQRLKDTRARNVPTLMVTGWHNGNVEECAQSVGCAAVLSKSASLVELDEAVSCALRHAA